MTYKGHLDFEIVLYKGKLPPFVLEFKSELQFFFKFEFDDLFLRK